MYKCPWCEHKTFSFWQKQSLGPIRSIRCVNCTRRVSVDWTRAHLAALPAFLLAVAGLYSFGAAFDSQVLAILGGSAGALLGSLVTAPLYHLYVPLVRPRR